MATSRIRASRSSPIIMVKPIQDRFDDNATCLALRSSASLVRNTLLESLVRPRGVEIVDVFKKDPPQMALICDENVI